LSATPAGPTLHALPAAVQPPDATCRDVLIACLDALTDAAVRARLQRAAGKPGRRPAGRGSRSGAAFASWRESLRATDPGFATTADQLAVLQEELNRWQQDVTGGPVRARFRLVEPAAGAESEAGAGSAVDARPSPWVVEFGLQAADEPSLVVDAERVWRSRGTLKALARHVPAPQETLLAELGRALRLYPGLEPALRTARPTRLELDAAGAYAFLQEAAPALSAAGFGVLLPAWWGRPAARLGLRASASTPAQPGGVAGAAGLGQAALVDFRWEVALGDETLTEAELVALVELQQPLVRVRGQWVQLDAQRLRNGLKLVLENGSARLSVAELLHVVGSREAGPGGLPVVKVEADGWLGELLNGSGSARFEPVAVPDTFVGTLRPYQERGLAWLTFLQRVGVGAVLADDMGLGKTVQLLALMATDSASADSASADSASADSASADSASADSASADSASVEVGPTLLVCPMSVVGNWQREAARFTPHLRVHVHHGAERPRGKEFRSAVASSDLVLTTYALAARDAVALAAVPWRRVVLDEAQAVKNAATKAATAVRALPARHRIAVTGTPVENRLADLWSLMEFANPGLLGRASQFRQRFAIPVERHGDADAVARLRAVTQPFILRRVKTDRAIIADLPDKLEMEVVCGLTREQASLYQAVVEDMLRQVAESEGIQRRGLVLATMTKLKQVCNHPAQLLRDGSRLAGRSGKLARLEETLEEVLSAGEKALLFTQFAEFGAMLRAHLSTRFGQDVIFLHGGVAKADRDAMVARFQSGAPGAPSLFVLSLKAGGTGLTLTAANHVIHVDRWWNPAVEDQATDRAFRIGQTRNVQVRKLVCGGTLEERIAAMIRDKRGLAASIVGTGESWLTDLSTDELRELIRLDGDAVVE
jgi:non-specific serine/threonine protein kinase